MVDQYAQLSSMEDPESTTLGTLDEHMRMVLVLSHIFKGFSGSGVGLKEEYHVTVLIPS